MLLNPSISGTIPLTFMNDCLLLIAFCHPTNNYYLKRVFFLSTRVFPLRFLKWICQEFDVNRQSPLPFDTLWNVRCWAMQWNVIKDVEQLNSWTSQVILKIDYNEHSSRLSGEGTFFKLFLLCIQKCKLEGLDDNHLKKLWICKLVGMYIVKIFIRLKLKMLSREEFYFLHFCFVFIHFFNLGQFCVFVAAF